MRLDYNIYWFEDDEDFVEEISPGLTELLAGFGLRANINDSRSADVLDTLDLSEIDLIISDLNMDEEDEEDDTGRKIIEKIRNRGDLVEIFFYSALSIELEAAVAKLAGDMSVIQRLGVHAVRAGLIAKIGAFVKASIHKLEDVNNMRGLVIAQAIELESDIVNICATLLPDVSVLDECKNHPVLKKILKQKHKSFSKQCEKISESNGDEINVSTLVSQRWWTANDKLTLFKRAIEKSKEDFSKEKQKIIEKILENHSVLKDDLIKNRNILAHARVEIDGGVQKLRGLTATDEPIEPTREWCSDIRKRLLIHSDLLSDFVSS